jgi:NitT/TauT family transport system substrate-binding protein
MRPPHFARIRAVAVRLALATAIAAAALLPVRAAGPETIVFAWPGPLTIGYAPWAFADDLGLFKDEGLAISVVSLEGSGVILPQLMSGAVFTTFSTLDPLIIARQPGKPNFDFRFVYNSARNSIWEISVLDGSPIKSVKDLGGKTIGVGALTFGNVSMTKAILKQAGVDPNTVQFVAVGTGVPGFQALRSGKIDALNLFDIMDAEMRLEGTKIRLLRFPPEFSGVSSHAFPVTNKMIHDRPDLVAKFGRVAAEGTIACSANPTGCLLAYWKHYPELRPAGAQADALRVTLPLLDVRLKNMMLWQDGEPHKYGLFSDKDWTTEIVSLRVGGQITVDPKLDTLFTNQFVDDYNKFDVGAVVRKAKAYKPS